jgi:hypothetical protein
MKRILTVLLFTPCIGMCGVFGISKVIASGEADERKAVGEKYARALEASADAGAPPEHFTYHPLEDGGFTLYFAEPSFMLPTDFFYVWNQAEQRWDLREASQLPQ